jgi:hypothetical protein
MRPTPNIYNTFDVVHIMEREYILRHWPILSENEASAYIIR